MKRFSHPASDCVLASDIERHRQGGGRRHTNAWNMADSSLLRITNGGRAQEALQKGCIKCVWMPNWAHNTAFSAPSGFALALERDSKRAAVSPYLFHDPTKYAYGTLAIPLPADARNKRDGTPIADYLRQLADRKVGDNRLPSSAALLERVHDLVPSKYLEHDGSFAGLYASSDRKMDFSERLWVVVQAGDASAAKEAHRVVQQEGEGGSGDFNTTDASWNRFVERAGSPFARAKEASKERRSALANAILDDLLDFDHEGRDISAYGPITTVADVFSRLRHSGKICVYYSACTPTKYGGDKGRVVLNESPRTGVFLLHGVKPVLKHLGAFPYGTGRVASMAPFSVRGRMEPTDMPPEKVFCWDHHHHHGGSEHFHPRLQRPPGSDIFRMRTREFREMEIRLGRDPAARVVHLRPIAVKLARPRT